MLLSWFVEDWWDFCDSRIGHRDGIWMGVQLKYIGENVRQQRLCSFFEKSCALARNTSGKLTY